MHALCVRACACVYKHTHNQRHNHTQKLSLALALSLSLSLARSLSLTLAIHPCAAEHKPLHLSCLFAFVCVSACVRVCVAIGSTCDGVVGEGLDVGQVVVGTVLLQPLAHILLGPQHHGLGQAGKRGAGVVHCEGLARTQLETHAHTHTHTHTHTDRDAHARKHTQTHANTRKRRNTATHTQDKWRN